jgi:hypothetical protein
MRRVAGNYIRVGDKKGPLTVGGAQQKIDEDPDFNYLPQHGVAGTKADLLVWLKENKPDEDADDLFKNGYSQTSLKKSKVKAAFDREILLAGQERSKVRSRRSNMKNFDLNELGEYLRSYNKHRKENPKGTATVSKSLSALKEKVTALRDENKVLDITNMKKNGTKSSKMELKEGSNRHRLSNTESSPFYCVVYNPKAKSFDGVKNFLDNYGGFEKETIKTLLEAAKAGDAINIAQSKSPSRSTLASPRRKRRGKVDLDDLEE